MPAYGDTKLNEQQKRRVRRDAAEGIRQHVIAERYGVSLRTIQRVINGGEYDARKRRTLKPCGTDAAYQRHRRDGEYCLKCWARHAATVEFTSVLWPRKTLPGASRPAPEPAGAPAGGDGLSPVEAAC